MRRRLQLAAILFSLLLGSSAARAQDKLLTIDDLYDPVKRVNFAEAPPPRLQWLADGTAYLQAKLDPATGTRQLLKVDALTGKAAPFFDAAKMEAAFAALPGLSRDDARQIAH